MKLDEGKDNAYDRMVSVSVKPGARYAETESLSPGERYPEYPFSDICLGRNDPYEMVRECLIQMGLDARNVGTGSWNPLGHWIERGQKVVLLPNLVSHGRSGMTAVAHHARITHGSVLRAAMDYVFLACGSPDCVSFGNAPLQSCSYDLVLRQSRCDSVADFYRKQTKARIGPFDLRAVVGEWTRAGTKIREWVNPDAEIVSVDLGTESLLDGFYRNELDLPQVRVGDYKPSETVDYHSRGRHIYLVNKRVLDADVIVSVPKLKTHQKVGMTCALKGTVGTIARKECLAHHRSGGSLDGGDEFRQSSSLNRLATRFVGRTACRGTGVLDNSLRFLSKAFYKSIGILSRDSGGGAWYGNDTAWRMALDVARILRYARPDGTLSQTPVRKHLVFVDGIVAGEGNGPLAPAPVGLGAIAFGADACAVDYLLARMVGFDPEAMPLIRESFRLPSYPPTDLAPDEVRLLLNGAPFDALSVPCVHPMVPPRGWVNHIEDSQRNEWCNG